MKRIVKLHDVIISAHKISEYISYNCIFGSMATMRLLCGIQKQIEQMSSSVFD